MAIRGLPMIAKNLRVSAAMRRLAIRLKQVIDGVEAQVS